MANVTASLGCEPKWELEDFRLPPSVLPLNYDVYLFPNLDDGTFSGHVDISVNATEAQEFMLVHVKNLTVTKTQIKDETGNVVALTETFEYEPKEFWVMIPEGGKFAAGNYSIYLEFEGSLVNGIVGFYRSIYLDDDGNEHKIATSKFQPTYARRAFPCLDEPSFKSTFRVTLVKPSSENYIALSNMPEESIAKDKPTVGFSEVTFQPSVPMVTYLAIFIVCDFDYISKATDVHKIPFRVYGSKQQIPRLEYALEMGAAVTDFYESYFTIPYPLPKLHMAGIPDYSSGATEHWGLITYRESNLIYDPLESSAANKERVALVIAHELAHQWFGNLMTVKWWNDLWLNEGFATFMEYKGVKSFETDWDAEGKFLTSDLHPVLVLDATKSSHPIVVDVDTPDQITAIFDMIAYNKGASVIRMIENFLGEGDFRQGIINFLQKFSFQNAVTEDLLKELSAVSSEGLNVSHIVSTWTMQKGFPVVIAKKIPIGYSLTQERFLTSDDGSDDEVSPFGYKWEIPISYKSSGAPDLVIRKWLHANDEASMEINVGDSEWTKLNLGQFGYYRVLYPDEDWQTFATKLQANLEFLSASDRMSLINDAFALADAGRLDYARALDMTLYLNKERALAAWETAFFSLDRMADIFYFSPVYSDFTKYLSQLLTPLYEELGWVEAPDESLDQSQMRVFVLKKMSTYSGGASEKAGEMLLAYKATGQKVSPNLREIVYSFGMKASGNLEEWNWMLQLYKNESNAQEKTKLLRGLTSISEPWILSHLIDLAMNDDAGTVFRSQDFFTLLTYMSWNRVGEPIVWDFLRSRWLDLVDKFTLNDRNLGRMVADVSKKFASQQRLDEMKEFFAKYPEAGAGEAYRKTALETLQNNIKFVAAQLENVQTWLKSDS